MYAREDISISASGMDWPGARRDPYTLELGDLGYWLMTAEPAVVGSEKLLEAEGHVAGRR